jgi:hypothetical protein
LVRISGKVTLDGKPVKEARVEFAREGGTTAQGVTQEDGSYQLYTSQSLGAEPGKYTVQIRLYKPGDTATQLYPMKSTQTKEITARDNAMDFALKSDDVDFTPVRRSLFD